MMNVSCSSQAFKDIFYPLESSISETYVSSMCLLRKLHPVYSAASDDFAVLLIVFVSCLALSPPLDKLSTD